MRKDARKKYGYNAFEAQMDAIDLEAFFKFRLIHWIEMKKHNSLEIRRFLAEFFSWKYPYDVHWISYFREEGLL